MAKRTDTVALKGTLDGRLLTEESKDSISTYDLEEILASFDGECVSITIKKETSLPTVKSTVMDEEEDEPDV